MPNAGDTLNVAFVHANVITVDTDFTVTEAVWVKDGIIQAVGTTQNVTASIDSDTRIVDLAGRTVMPGFIDTHGHIALFGLDKLNVDLTGALSKQAILECVAAAARVRTANEWILTTPIGTPPYFLDFETIRASGELPSREELDRAAPENPVYIMAPTNRVPNSAILNSAALRRAGIDENTNTNAPIEIVRAASGALTGELRGAMQPLYNPHPFYEKIAAVIPSVTYGDIREGIRALAPEFIRGGTTTLLEAHLTRPEELRAYGELYENGELPLRVFFTFEVEMGLSTSEIENFASTVRFAAGNGFGHSRLKVVGISAGWMGPIGMVRRATISRTRDRLAMWVTRGRSLRRRRTKPLCRPQSSTGFVYTRNVPGAVR